jgi:4-hydroxy-3-polyprenylbenzoate decarboxylase
MKKICLGITGASGAVYGVRMAEALLAAEVEVHLVISAMAETVMRHELPDYGPDYIEKRFQAALGENRLHLYDNRDIAAPLASGSFLLDGMLVAPCSMNTLALIAHGLSATLIARAAGVALKEARPLALVPRETPLSSIHLQNMLTLAQNRAIIIPAMPGFYTHPASIEDMVDFIVGKVLDVLGIDHQLWARYTGL